MDKLEKIKLTDIIPDPTQPRKDFDPDKIIELAESIDAVGQVQAITVQRIKGAEFGKPQYMIIAGERRWQASQHAGKETITAIVVDGEKEFSNDKVYAHQITENLHRENLNPVELGEFLEKRLKYLKEQGISNPREYAAKELGKSPSWISKNTAILKYGEDVRSLARNGKMRDYSILKKINNLGPEKRKTAIQLIEEGQFNSKEFFARKRYDTKKVEPKEQTPTQKKEEQKPLSLKLQLSPDQVIRLIEKTEFSFVLDKNAPTWRNTDNKEMSIYMDKFMEWVNDSI
ncbi:ParB/RepB/Spo0J family partition protein [Algicola sagamiensis]|uniref:ParB/RepB/Spo0J family partition protein n=1 Tax=Algicola sagamiensis TaxID=163869 RepID=UPI00036FA9D8|nr:ParB/RepB/Spo0J family partition protein [Algicola sagamiensis]